jgi:hypothetical protein
VGSSHARRGRLHSTTANPDGSFDHGVVAAKGRRVMVINYLTRTATAVPAVTTLSHQQYATR